MANLVYPKAKEAFLKGDLDLDSDVKVSLLDAADYTYSAAHEFYSSANTNVVATSGNLASKTFTNGTFDAADLTISGVTGDQFEYILVWQDTGNAATSRLICLFDTATGLPVTPSGTDVIVQWHSSGIFSL